MAGSFSVLPLLVCSKPPCCKETKASGGSSAAFACCLRSCGGSSRASSVKLKVPQCMPKLFCDFTSCTSILKSLHIHTGLAMAEWTAMQLDTELKRPHQSSKRARSASKQNNLTSNVGFLGAEHVQKGFPVQASPCESARPQQGPHAEPS